MEFKKDQIIYSLIIQKFISVNPQYDIILYKVVDELNDKQLELSTIDKNVSYSRNYLILTIQKQELKDDIIPYNVSDNMIHLYALSINQLIDKFKKLIDLSIKELETIVENRKKLNPENIIEEKILREL